jgi:hypothetical protein
MDRGEEKSHPYIIVRHKNNNSTTKKQGDGGRTLFTVLYVAMILSKQCTMIGLNIYIDTHTHTLYNRKLTTAWTKNSDDDDEGYRTPLSFVRETA